MNYGKERFTAYIYNVRLTTQFSNKLIKECETRDRYIWPMIK